MNEVCREILSEIKKADKIAFTRHIRPDGDAIGSTYAFAQIVKLSFPSKKVVVIGRDSSDEMSFLGKDDEKPSDLSEYLGIVLDTATTDRISEPDILKCRKLIKIDHHIEVEKFGDISWVEDKRSSLCEMVSAFWYANKEELKIDKFAATCLYTGIVTDTGRFKYSEVTSETLFYAGLFLDMGIDAQLLYARLEMQTFSFYKFQAYALGKMQISPSGVAYLYVDKKMQQDFKLSREQASESVNFLSSIKGSLIWMVFIDNEDKDTRVRVRSRFVEINKLAEKYSGGGHAMASGATVHNAQEMQALIDDADKLLKDFKAEHKDLI